MHLQYLTDVHTRRYAQRVQDNLERCSVRQKRHVFLGKNTRNNALITVTTRHFIADRDFPLLCDITTYNLCNTRRHIITVCSCKHFYIYYNTIFTVRNFKRSITYFSCLFAEYRTQKSFLSRKLGFTLWCNLSDKNISGTDLCTDSDNTSLIQISETVLTYIRNIPCYFFRAKFGFARFYFVFLYMNRGEYIIFYKLFVKQDSILIVITFPSHKSYKNITSQAYFAVLC